MLSFLAWRKAPSWLRCLILERPGIDVTDKSPGW